jgi:hypothetical protein
MFKKKNIIKFLFFYLSIKLLLLIVGFFISSNFFQIFNIENSGNPDLVFNDLHFKAQYKDCQNNPHYTRKKSVVLINSGSLDIDSFRLELSKVLKKLKDYKPAAIGIDHDFSKTEKIGTDSLKLAIESNPKIVVSYRSLKDDNTIDSSYLEFNSLRGDTRFPDFYTIRNYFGQEQTFAFQLTKIAYPDKVQKLKIPNNTFNINYCSVESGIFTYHPDSVFVRLFEDTNNIKLNAVNFKYIEADDLLKLNDSLNSDIISEVIKDKIVIIGHLGTNLYDKEYDIQDKFPVPIDNERIMLREKKMHGAVIHANAVENIIHPDSRFTELSFISDFLFHELLCILFLLLMFLDLGKLANLLILIGISIPYVIVVLNLMSHHVYIPTTSTLLSLFFIEEFYEIVEPIHKYFTKRLKFLSDET